MIRALAILLGDLIVLSMRTGIERMRLFDENSINA